MPLYLAPYEVIRTRRVGPQTLPVLRPLGADQPGWSAIQLRDQDQTRRCFLVLPVANADARLELIADDVRDATTSAMRDRLASRLRLTEDLSTAPTMAHLIARALMVPPVGGWNPLVPARGQYEVWLGGRRIWSLPVIQGGAGYGTTFPTTENPLSEAGRWDAGYADWTNVQVVSGKVRASATGTDAAARLLAPSMGANQWVQANLFIIAGGGGEEASGLTVRMHPSSSTDESCYVMYDESPGGVGLQFSWYEVDAAFGFTSLANDATDPTSGNVIYIEATGSLLEAFDAGTPRFGGGITDTTIVSGQPGMALYGTTLANAEVDNWSCGDYQPFAPWRPRIHVTA